MEIERKMNVQTLPSRGWLIDSLQRAIRPYSSIANTESLLRYGPNLLNVVVYITDDQLRSVSETIALAFMVGTGGVADARYLQERKERGYRLAAIHGGTEAPAPARTPAEDLARVRSVLKPTMSALADLFGVSRQAIYNWANGEQPKPEYAKRLDDMARAADIIAAEGVGNPAQALKRKIADGKTLLDIVAAGGSAQSAAHKLAMILRREAEQRKELEAKLAGRRTPLVPVDEYASPMLDRHG